jgi:hypothetical protein
LIAPLEAAVAAPPAARPRWWQPQVHEVLALAYVAACALALETMGRPYPRSALLLAYGRFGVVVVLVASLVLAAARLLLRRRRELPPLHVEVLRVGRAALFLLPVLASHFVLKSFTHLLNRRVLDPQLAELDRRLHLGIDPGRFLTTLFGERLVLQAIDVFYSGLYYVVVVGSTALLLALLPHARRRAFVTAFMLVFMAGSALYLAVPSWGPVFVWPGDFAQALSHMPLTWRVQAVLFQEISSIVHDPDGDLIIRYGSVAAFPSLHLAVVTLFAVASRGVSRPWSVAGVVIVLLMLISSVVTGYHYLLDGYAGLGMALGAWWTGRRLHPDEARTARAACGRPRPAG